MNILNASNSNSSPLIFAVVGIVVFCVLLIVTLCVYSGNYTRADRPVLKTVLVLALIGVFIFTGLKVADYFTQNFGKEPTNTDGQTELLSRSARYNDISIVTNQEFSLSVPFTLTAHTDIKNLQVTIYFLDESKDVVRTKNKYLGNVYNRQIYNFSFELSEFEISDLWTIEYWRYEVTGGTVSYFANS
ncbi:MAG: hypothetical protein J6B04_01445 [Clostridia bacterium]|nr:hypothetical protein [Clostridia bacterium]